MASRGIAKINAAETACVTLINVYEVEFEEQPRLVELLSVREGDAVAEVLLFHHALGQTSGFLAFAEELRQAGHTVHTPDLYAGHVFERLEGGAAYANQTGFDVIIGRGAHAADGLSNALVYAGFSLGVLPAQKLAQTRPGARGALLFHACVPISTLSASWPADVPVQIHGMDADPFFAGEGDIDAARDIVNSVPNAELFLYPGDQHLFADASLPSFDAVAAALLMQRVTRFLDVAASG